MDETTNEILIREVREYGPDGNSVLRYENIQVQVIWPEKKPDGRSSYHEVGDWSITHNNAE